jgi:hypothetical protein
MASGTLANAEALFGLHEKVQLHVESGSEKGQQSNPTVASKIEERE